MKSDDGGGPSAEKAASEGMDLYSLLEIERSASSEEIKKSYRKLALKYHPDKNAGDSTSTEKFKAISNAYKILSDSNQKSIYDTYGEQGLDAQSQVRTKPEDKTFFVYWVLVGAWLLSLVLDYYLSIPVEWWVATIASLYYGRVPVLIATKLPIKKKIPGLVAACGIVFIVDLLIYFILPTSWLSIFATWSLYCAGLVYVNTRKLHLDMSFGLFALFIVGDIIFKPKMTGFWNSVVGVYALLSATLVNIVLGALLLSIALLSEKKSVVFVPCLLGALRVLAYAVRIVFNLEVFVFCCMWVPVWFLDWLLGNYLPPLEWVVGGGFFLFQIATQSYYNIGPLKTALCCGIAILGIMFLHYLIPASVIPPFANIVLHTVIIPILHGGVKTYLLERLRESIKNDKIDEAEGTMVTIEGLWKTALCLWALSIGIDFMMRDISTDWPRLACTVIIVCLCFGIFVLVPNLTAEAVDEESSTEAESESVDRKEKKREKRSRRASK